jgi:DNA adenine methylase
MATLTPFRYPGAKNKLLPILREHLDKIMVGQDSFIDVFVGGGSVLLDVAARYPNIKLYANDKDYWVASFWKIVSGDDQAQFDALLALIATQPTLKLFNELRSTPTSDPLQSAYRAIFFNRTTFSGIFYSGPIGGKEQKSQYTVDCRYNAKKIQDKMRACRKLLLNRTTVACTDFASYDVLWNAEAPAYLDPPYYVKGDALYIEKMDSFAHEKMAALLQYRDNWVLSYDDCPEIRKLYSDNQIIDLAARYCINGKKDNWESKNELIILGS